MKHGLRISFHHTSDISTLLLTRSMNLLVSFLHALVDKVSVLVFSYVGGGGGGQYYGV